MKASILSSWLSRLLPQKEKDNTPLLRVLRERIDAQGPLTMEAFMQIVLHDPDHGYYRKGVPVGRDGDFSTAPEHSQMFGEMVGVWCIQTWQAMGKPDPFALLELGPGRGTLMKSLLSGLAGQADFCRALRLHFLESNPAFRAMQDERLAAFHPVHIDTLGALPRLPLLVVGNEFFDTFPMRQFIYRNDGWHERMVGTQGQSLATREGPVVERPKGFLDDIKLKDGWFYETSPRSLALVSEIARHLCSYGGAGLLIDYGYDVPTGKDTLFALRGHKHTDILSCPGETDVTGDVDFAAFRREAQAQGARVWGPIGQGEFFSALGIAFRAHQLRVNSPEHAAKIDEELFKLTHPSAMGAWFKVLGLCGQQIESMAGFRSS